MTFDGQSVEQPPSLPRRSPLIVQKVIQAAESERQQQQRQEQHVTVSAASRVAAATVTHADTPYGSRDKEGKRSFKLSLIPS